MESASNAARMRVQAEMDELRSQLRQRAAACDAAEVSIEFSFFPADELIKTKLGGSGGCSSS